jgi:hypothetical protein
MAWEDTRPREITGLDQASGPVAMAHILAVRGGPETFMEAQGVIPACLERAAGDPEAVMAVPVLLVLRWVDRVLILVDPEFRVGGPFIRQSLDPGV